MSARGLLWRWSLRTLRREWRQHASVFALIAIAVALSVGGVVAAYNLSEPPELRFGTGHVRASVIGTEADQAMELLADQGLPFGVMTSGSVIERGAVPRIIVRVIDPDDAVVAPLIGLVAGAWPTGPGEVAVSDGAPTETRALGATLELAGEPRTIVGIVENPTDLDDEFVLADGLDGYGIEPRLQTSVLFVDAAPAEVTFPAGAVSIVTEDRGDPSAPSVRTVVAITVSLVAAIAMVEVALLAGASFAVMARRRARQFGLLGSVGATPRQLRQAATANGLAIGSSAALTGAAVGLAIVAAVVPRMEQTVRHRIDLAVPWWTVVPTAMMAIAAAAVAAWWPSRALSRQPIVQVLASMRPRPSSTAGSTRFGVVAAVVGTVVLIVGTGRLSTLLVVVGIVAALVGLLALSPALIRMVGRRAVALPLAGRMAGRAIARQQGRSAALVAALTIALGIPVGLAAVTASIDEDNRTKDTNLAEGTAIGWVPGTEEHRFQIPFELEADAGAQAGTRMQAAVPGALLTPIDVVVDPAAIPASGDLGPRVGTVLTIETNFGVRPFDGVCGASCDVMTLGDRDENGDELELTLHDAWVGTPELLTALGIETSPRTGGAQAISRFDDASLKSHRGQSTDLAADVIVQPDLPLNTSIAPTLIRPELVAENGWEVVTVGWMVTADRPFTADELDRLAAAAGDDLVVESIVRPVPRTGIRIAGILIGGFVSLGIVAAAIGLQAADSADDLRILQAIGAGPRSHRHLSAATAAILAGAGALIAVPTGYLALAVLIADRSTRYRFAVPWASLAVIMVLIPVLAAGLGWLNSRTHTTNLAAPVTR